MESFINGFVLSIFAYFLGKIEFEKIYGVLSFQGLLSYRESSIFKRQKKKKQQEICSMLERRDTFKKSKKVKETNNICTWKEEEILYLIARRNHI